MAHLDHLWFALSIVIAISLFATVTASAFGERAYIIFLGHVSDFSFAARLLLALAAPSLHPPKNQLEFP
jgi:hypothetical protein